ncbi:hypothetical protein BIY22_16145 [Vibrio panuliri]|uniref:diguanylate cyclase n=1 Tax=Vibrio panuliri TaxID=1381081 RepID=A0A1Q9HNC8_9VIBR|nr:diguanylate cyclase [Vibrio panuliri]OLQ92342.1 hypothetical protein BIY22_16145 [Vibrio panuliri]
MQKKITLSLLIVFLSMLIVVTVDTFLLGNTEQQASEKVTEPQPETQLRAIDPHHALLALFERSGSNSDDVLADLHHWREELTRQPQTIERIFQLWIERNVARNLKQHDQIVQLDHELWEIATDEPVPWLEAKLYTEKATELLREDSYQQGLDSIKRAIEIAEEHHADFILLESYNTAGILHNALNQLKQSQLYFSQGLELGERFPDSDYVGRFNNNLGLLFVHLEQWDQSINYLLKAKSFYLAPERNGAAPLPVIYFNLSYVYSELKNVHKAREYYQKALKYINSDSSRYLHIVADKAKGRVDLLAGDGIEAEQSALRCLQDVEIEKYPKQKGICLYLRSMALYQQDQIPEALSVVSDSIDVFESIAHQRWLIRSNLLLAKILQANGDYQKALSIYQIYHAKERSQIIGEFHALETAFEVRNLEKERDLLSVQNQYKDLEGQVVADRFKVLALWLTIAFLVAGWFIVRSVLDRRQNKRLRALSYLDPLTGGGNRRLYYQELRQPEILNNQWQYRVVVVDIDWFKHINDKYGHDVGDEVLAAVALKLKSRIDEEELFIRWGGEEFLMLVKEREDFRAFAQSLVSVINHAPFVLSQETLNVSVSVGVSSSYHIDQIRHDSSAFAKADKCLYKAKAHGRNQYVIAEDFAD